MEINLTLEVNGKRHAVRVAPSTPLLYVLRNQLALNGPKFGCGLGQCGACLVLLDGKAAPSCQIPVEAAQPKAITTLEGLTRPDGSLHPVQQAFVDQQAAQCGYCLNGMVVSAVALLTENPQPDEAAIRSGLQRQLCRCGIQPRVIRAIQQAAHDSQPSGKPTLK